MYMVMFVLDDPGKFNELLKAWMNAGIMGATIIESTGMNRQLAPCPPMRYSYGTSSVREAENLSAFVVVNDEEQVKKCLIIAEKIVGNLDDPNTGVFTAWPLTLTKGIPDGCERRGADGLG
jgi:nitrogen regulatory protein P-II 1